MDICGDLLFFFLVIYECDYLACPFIANLQFKQTI